MPGGGGIGLPPMPRNGGAAASASLLRVGGAGGAEGGSGTDVGGASAAAAGAAAGSEGSGGAGRAAGGGGVGGAGRAASSSTRRTGGAGRPLPLEVTRRAPLDAGRVGGGVGGGVGGASGVGVAAAGAGGASAGALAVSADFGALLAVAALVDFLALAGSSGWTSRVRPSRSALRMTRSACASSMLEECVLTPIPSEMQRSSVSLFVIPSSLASSCTRFLGAKFLVQSFEVS